MEAGANQRSRAQGAKHWNARVLSKQAQKVRGHLIERWKIYRGDQVMVNTGKDRGQVGTVTKVFRKENRLIVEGMNLVKKHVKRTEQNQGGVISMEAPIHYSNVNLVDPVTGSPVRIAMRYLDDGTKVRVTRGRLAADPSSRNRTCVMQRRRPRSTKVGSRDTSWQDACATRTRRVRRAGGSSGGSEGDRRRTRERKRRVAAVCRIIARDRSSAEPIEPVTSSSCPTPRVNVAST